MLNIGGVSLRGFNVALRFVRVYNKVPQKISELTQEHNDYIKSIAKEYDRRKLK